MSKEHIHPPWYYGFYNSIFAWSRDYKKDIEIINNIEAINNKIVLEVGAGTGNHLDEIILYNPKHIIALDIDSNSIDYLRNKYKQFDKITIYQQDGFIQINHADIIICLYCILQQTDNSLILHNRINNLIKQVQESKSVLFLEMLDTDKHKPHDNIRIYSNGTDYVDILSVKTDYGILIQYSGMINDLPINYSVPIHKCPIELLISDNNLLYHKTVPITESGRKYILCMKY